MEKVKYLVGLIFIVILFSYCNNGAKNNNNTVLYAIDTIEKEQAIIEQEYTINDYIEVTLDVYEAKNDICAIFDSIIDIVNNCPEMKHLQIGYIFDINYRNDTLKISINTIDYLLNDKIYSYAQGVFFHKGYQFVYFGAFFDEFFVNKNQTIMRFSIDSAKLFPDIDDTGYLGNWEYVYEENNFRNVYFSCCYYMPTDRKYYTILQEE
jgi:hypothetical protein